MFWWTWCFGWKSLLGPVADHFVLRPWRMWLYKDLNMGMVVFVIVTVKVLKWMFFFSFNAPHHRRACKRVHVCVFLQHVCDFCLYSPRKTGNAPLRSPLREASSTLRSPLRPPPVPRALLFSHTPDHGPHCPPPCPHCLRKRRTHLKIWTAHPALPAQ